MVNDDKAQTEKTGNVLVELRSRSRRIPGLGNTYFPFSFEHVTRFFIVSGVALYVLGLLVVNIYLFQLGISDFAVLRVRYILTGILMFAFIIAGVGTIAFVQFCIREIRRAGQNSDRTLSADVASHRKWLHVIALFAFLFSMLFLARQLFSLEAPFFDLYFLVAMPMLVPLILVLLYEEIFGSEAEAADSDANSRRWIVVLIALLASSLLFLDFLASSIYPAIPAQFGGGKPRTVQLLMSPANSAAASNLLGSIIGSNGVSEPVDLLWETSDYFVIREKGDKAGSIYFVDRDAVLGMRGQPRFSLTFDDLLGIPTLVPNSSPDASPTPQ